MTDIMQEMFSILNQMTAPFIRYLGIPSVALVLLAAAVVAVLPAGEDYRHLLPALPHRGTTRPHRRGTTRPHRHGRAAPPALAARIQVRGSRQFAADTLRHARLLRQHFDTVVVVVVALVVVVVRR